MLHELLKGKNSKRSAPVSKKNYLLWRRKQLLTCLPGPARVTSERASGWNLLHCCPEPLHASYGTLPRSTGDSKTWHLHLKILQREVEKGGERGEMVYKRKISSLSKYQVQQFRFLHGGIFHNQVKMWSITLVLWWASQYQGTPSDHSYLSSNN